MPSDRKLAANRANAQKSTGPRSTAGKKKASRNALRHGLTSRSAAVDEGRAIEVLVQELLTGLPGSGASAESIMPSVRALARAELELARLGSIKRVLLENSIPSPFDADEQGGGSAQSYEEKATAEAVRQSLPELHRLRRYEKHARKRRDDAIRVLLLHMEDTGIN